MLVGAVPESIERFWELLETQFGSVNGYLDSIGCNAEWRAACRERMVESVD